MSPWPQNPAHRLRRGLFARAGVDGVLAGALLLLMGLALSVLYSAGDHSFELVRRQALNYTLGIALMLAVARIPLPWLRWASLPLYLLGLALLLAVMLVGDIGQGAQRWLDLGVIRFQPAEIMKLALPMALAWFFHVQGTPPRFWPALGGLLLIALPAVLIVEQPDLGTALLVTSAGFFALFLAGLHAYWFIVGALIALPGGWIMWTQVMHDYQRQRVLTFLDPESDPLGAGYHIIQSKIAVGSGGLHGKGWLNGTQSHLDFLPERSTDFILAVFAEEFGLFGVGALLVLYLIIVWRGLYIAARAPDTFGRLLAGSVALTFFVYVFVNAGMISGLLPVVGVPLPLMSYGGTAAVTLLAGFGILMAMHNQRYAS